MPPSDAWHRASDTVTLGRTQTSKCLLCAGVANSFPPLFWGTILHECTAPQKVPMGSNVLIILVACSLQNNAAWNCFTLSVPFLVPWNHFPPKSLSLLRSPKGTQVKISTLCHTLKVATECIKWGNDLLLFGNSLIDTWFSKARLRA